MLIASFLKWWYTSGFKGYLASFVDRLKDAVDFFSIRLLLRDFFAPFHQISAEGTTSLALDAKISAAFDYILSCVIGATVRFFILIAGFVVIIFQLVLGTLGAVLWPLAPVLVVYCVCLYFKGVIL